MGYRKVLKKMVVKVGSSSLTDKAGQLSKEKIEKIVNQLIAVQQSGEWQVVLVTSGAVSAGVSKLGWGQKVITMPEKQAAAAVGQGLLIHLYERLFRGADITVGQMLLTRSDIEDRRRFVHIRNTMTTLLQRRIVPIVNENDTVAVEEIRFGDNDTLASLVGMVAEAEIVVLLTDIDGFYSHNPKFSLDAKRLTDVYEITEEMEQVAGGAGSSVGTGGMRTKLAAAKIAMDSGADLIIASSEEKDVLQRIMAGEAVGTTFHRLKIAVPSRKSWLLHGARADGCVTIDDGAIRAVVHGSGSLLIPGIIDIEGDFDAGNIVDMKSGTGETLGRGIVTFASSDLRSFIRRKRFGERLLDLPEVIHRNDLVLLKGETK